MSNRDAAAELGETEDRTSRPPPHVVGYTSTAGLSLVPLLERANLGLEAADDVVDASQVVHIATGQRILNRVGSVLSQRQEIVERHRDMSERPEGKCLIPVEQGLAQEVSQEIDLAGQFLVRELRLAEIAQFAAQRVDQPRTAAQFGEGDLVKPENHWRKAPQKPAPASDGGFARVLARRRAASVR